jgi:triosephosphate isomerase (TIM)
MRKSLIAGNWKMHASHLEAIQMVQKLSLRLDFADHDRVDVVVVPPFTALRSTQTVIEADRLLLNLGAQNCHWEDSGAYTGEISPAMLKKLSVRFVIVGHSERRQIFGESDVDVNKKVKAVLGAGMTPILCVGETAEEYEAAATREKVGSQIAAGLRGLTADNVSTMVIAYEPIWAIGTGKTASADDAGEMAAFVRETVMEEFGAVADDMRVLYGGSVKPGNIAGLMAKRDIDGALVGGASLDPDTFASIVRYWI